VQHMGTVTVNWYPDDGTEPYSVPEFRDSIDNKDIELTLQLPLDRAEEMVPGKGIRITGFPKYAGTYLITGVNYPLAGPGTVTVNAATVRNPEPQKAGDEKGSRSSDSSDDGPSAWHSEWNKKTQEWEWSRT